MYHFQTWLDAFSEYPDLSSIDLKACSVLLPTLDLAPACSIANAIQLIMGRGRATHKKSLAIRGKEETDAHGTPTQYQSIHEI